MNRSKLVFVMVFVMVIGGLIGCGQKPQAANSSEAITQAKQLPTTEEQMQYLVREANAFINSDQFDEAIKTAKYVLSKLDGDSQEAKSIIEKAKAEIQQIAQKAADDVKSGVKDKLGSFGQ